MRFHQILRGYVRDYALPGMLSEGWIFKPAKSYRWKQARRGPEYHVDQSLRTHILNGLFALTRLLEYLEAHGYYHISEVDFKRTLVLYTLHDAYKDSALAKARTGQSEFSVPLSALEELIERMRLREFVDITAEDIRLASVSLLSPKVADLSAATTGISPLLTLVHLADALASQQTARDCGTAENRLREISKHEAVNTRVQTRMHKRLGTSAPVEEGLPELLFYYHELDDYRGLSTLLMHQATEEALAPLGLYPILYFANGILYLGPKERVVEVDALRKTVARTLFAKIRAEAGEGSYDAAQEALNYGQGLKFRKDVYLYSSLDTLLQVVQDYPIGQKSAGFLAKIIDKRVNKKKYSSPEEFYRSFDIPPQMDGDEAFASRWRAAYNLFMGIENIAEALVGGDTLEWLLTTFHTPLHVAQAIRQQSKLLRSGGASDHCIIIAYHWLVEQRFGTGKRIAQEVEVADIQHKLSREGLRALTPYDKEERRLAFVNEELGLESDIAAYLESHLMFSGREERSIQDNRLKLYEQARSRSSHKRMCLICNRDIPATMKSNVILTNIAGQQAQVFSNKLQPSQEVKGQMVWCPMCYLEFMLRKLSRQSYPQGSDYTASYRLHLYVLPDYSFTPQLWEFSGQALLRDFYPKETAVSRLQLRGSKDEPALPRLWLEQRQVDPAWLTQVRDMFANQATYMKAPSKDGKKRSPQGDRLAFSFKHPNYLLMTYDTIVPERADKGLAPTHIEVWTKALYAAVLVHLLTGARVYITDKPYLSITRPEQMKTIIETEGLHPLLRGLLPVARTDTADTGLSLAESHTRLPIATLPTLLDLLAAVWEINAALFQGKTGERRNLDKQVASILEEVQSNYLAGATLYKIRARHSASAYPAFKRACQLLLPQHGEQADPIRHSLSAEGYELLLDTKGGDWMSLAERITDTSWQLYHPSAKEHGRAHRFETLFRTGVEAIKTNAQSVENDEELISRVAGTVLKRLERIAEAGGYCPIYGAERLAVTEQFATQLVKELFVKLCARSVSKLSHEENHLADAIYFLTFQKVTRPWAERNKNKDVQADEEESA